MTRPLPIQALVLDYYGVVERPGGQLDTGLLAYVQGLQPRLPAYLFTSCTPAELRPFYEQGGDATFVRVVTSQEIGYGKSDPRAYRRLAQFLGIIPETTLFVDDTPARVRAAQEAGFQGLVYCQAEQLKTWLKSEHDGCA